MRHANPSAKKAGMSDHDRPLDARGQSDARLAGSFMLGERLVPDLILSSTAARARATAVAVSETAAGCTPPLLLPELYMADHEDLICRLKSLPGRHGTVMIVGHNPGLEGLVEALTGRRVALCTSALALLRLPVERWRDVGTGTAAELARLWQP